MAVLISRAICRELQLDAGVAAVVTKKVFDMVAPRTASIPLITVQVIGTEQARDQTGGVGLEFARIQINAYQTTAKLAKDLADLIKVAIDAVIGAAIGSAPNNIADVRVLLLIDEFQDSTPPSGGTDVPDYVQRMEYEAWYVPV